MTIKLIAIDIDDTLLSSKQEILPSTIEVVGLALKAGIKVVLCTGRPLAGAAHFLKQLKITGSNQYVITFNGAVIESVTGDVLAKHLVENSDYRAMTSFAEEHHIPFNVLDENSNIYTTNRNINWLTVVQAHENLAGIYVRTPQELPLDFKVAKGLFVGEPALLDQIEPAVRQKFQDHLYVVRAGRNFLELMNAHVNKGQALQDLAEELDLKPSEIMAIGDEINDLSMFDFAGTAVAMGNGNKLVKEHSSYVTATNDDDGIAKAIRKFVL